MSMGTFTLCAIVFLVIGCIFGVAVCGIIWLYVSPDIYNRGWRDCNEATKKVIRDMRNK